MCLASFVSADLNGYVKKLSGFSFASYPYTLLPFAFPPSLSQVFADYQKFLSTYGPGPRFLPTPSFYYGMEIGKEFTQTFTLPSSLGK
jgi:hypothetical protein